MKRVMLVRMYCVCIVLFYSLLPVCLEFQNLGRFLDFWIGQIDVYERFGTAYCKGPIWYSC